MAGPKPAAIRLPGNKISAHAARPFFADQYLGPRTECKTARSTAKEIVVAACISILLVSSVVSESIFFPIRNIRRTTGIPLLQEPTTSFDEAVKEAFSLVDFMQEDRFPKRIFSVSELPPSSKGGLLPRDRQMIVDIYRNASSLFEYGLGESTYIADHVGIPRYAGIDSSSVLVSEVRGKVADHFRFQVADFGSTKAKIMFQYQVVPLLSEPEPFDVYMVDGRWRIPCMLLSFLHASARGADPANTVVLLHDCVPKGFAKPRLARSDGGVHRRADHLLDMVGHSGEFLCVYKRKGSTSDQELLDVWLSYWVPLT